MLVNTHQSFRWQEGDWEHTKQKKNCVASAAAAVVDIVVRIECALDQPSKNYKWAEKISSTTTKKKEND